MKKLKVLIIWVVFVGFIVNLNGGSIIPPPPFKSVNQTAILLIHGWGGQGAWDERNRGEDEDPPWGDLPDYLEEYLQGDFWTDDSKGDANRLFVYVDGFGEDEHDMARFTTYVDGGVLIGNDPDKWINRVRDEWNEKYKDNVSPLITTPYPENIILITHSAGGLVARSYLTDENNWRWDEEKGKRILDVSQIITAQAPHTGSDYSPTQSLNNFYALGGSIMVAGAIIIASGNVLGGIVTCCVGGVIILGGVAISVYSAYFSDNFEDFSYYSTDLVSLNNKELTEKMEKVKWGNIYVDDVMCTLSTAYRPPSGKFSDKFHEFVETMIGHYSPLGYGDGFIPASSQKAITWTGKLNYLRKGENVRIGTNFLYAFAHFRKHIFNDFRGWGDFLDDEVCQSISKGTMQSSDFVMMPAGQSAQPGLLMEMPDAATATSRSETRAGDDEPEYRELDCINLQGDDLSDTETTIVGKILDFLPHKLQYCKVSFNFGEWEDIKIILNNDDFADPDFLADKKYIRDMYGNYKIRIREHVLEGQNIFIIETKNDYGIVDRRVVRITNNPMKLYAIPNSPMPRTSINPTIDGVIISISSDRTEYSGDPEVGIDYNLLIPYFCCYLL